MGVPNVFGSATTSIPLSQLDQNFNTTATLGNAAIGLGNVTTTVGNLTLTNVNITSGTINAAVTQSGFTGNSVIYSNTSGNLTTSANMTFSGTALTLANDASISGLTVGKGGGSVSNNTALGYQAGYSNTSGARNTFAGYGAGYSNTTGLANTFVGGPDATGGYSAGYSNTSGSYNVALGDGSLAANTTASNNTAVGYQAGYSNTVGINTVYIGYQAGYSQNVGAGAGYSTLIGSSAGYSLTTGTENTFIGSSHAGTGAGYYVTTGSKNTILGGYSGNQGGLDIRTASNYIVLSDGDGNPRGIFDSSGNLLVGQTSSGLQNSLSYALQTDGNFRISHTSGTASGSSYVAFGYGAGTSIGSITQNGSTGVLYNLTSDYRLKNNPTALTGASEFIMALQPKTWDWWDGSGKGVGFIAHEFMEVAKYSGNGTKDEVDAEGKPVYQTIQPSSSEVMANLVAMVQELKAEFDAYKATHP